jgi:3-methyladenine DNA glycosylase AlkD
VSQGASLAGEIAVQLRATGTPDRAAAEKRYLKSDLEFYGVTVPAIRRIAIGLWRDEPGLDHGDLVEAVDVLWATGVHECRMAAVELLAEASDLLGRDDLALLERLLRESRTWALVDGLAATVVGALDTRDGIGQTLEQWAMDEDPWIRRSALLAHLGGLRTGEANLDRFLRFADGMLDE